MRSRSALLVLADGRLPTGGYAHSAGLEQAIRQGWVNDIDGLRDFLRGRLHTTGLMNAAFAVAAWNALEEDTPTEAAPTSTSTAESSTGTDILAEAALRDLDAELIARTPSPALRRIGSWLGTLMLRSMRSIHPHPLLDAFPKDLQQPIVYGAVGRVLGLSDADTAATVLHEAVTGPATAAVKLMHIDPFQAHGAIIDLAYDLDEAAERAADFGRGDPAEIPALSAPLSDFAAELHEGDNVRLFAS
ncbi:MULTISPECIES: urease accessory protein UreF [unclassified Brevibacterium]|uniref:urease accessory protein UreF n=1 Tax=unclassified Brevibacterium TaxID=2614124 RepID=UPI0010932352|nr:urease accessory UreF family protein [Brevibacterium sp. S22]TGD29410.1 urease accessory protein UreF [Brevibacterium sp. S22]